MKTMAARLKQQYPRENNGVRVVPYHEHLVSNAHLGLLVLLGDRSVCLADCLRDPRASDFCVSG